MRCGLWGAEEAEVFGTWDLGLDSYVSLVQGCQRLGQLVDF